MPSIACRTPILWAGASAALLAVASLSTRGGGVESGVNSVPANAASQTPSCTSCHSGSAPFAGRTNGPTTLLTVSRRALALGETVAVTTSVTGGVAGTAGGFVSEATAGSFTPGANTRIISSNRSITHSNGSARTWNYSYTAPTAAGPLLLTVCGMSSNGSGSSGDRFSFHGFDNNATTATPVRLFVLPAGVANKGAACADGFGNQSVLGANSAPAVGNTGFACELIGAAPNALAFLLTGFNPPGFTSLNLGALFGLTGCSGYVASPLSTIGGFTSAGSAMMAEGTASFPLAIPNIATLSGVVINVQGAYFDNSIGAARALPISFSNGLTITIP